MPTVTISPPTCSTTSDAMTVSAAISVGDKQYQVYFRSAPGVLSTGVEPFLALALIPAMITGARLVAPGRVSFRLLEHLPVYQTILNTWYSNLQHAQVEATAAPQHIPAPGRGVGCFFSAGVDSFFSVLSHRQEITRLIFVHGLDVRLDNVALRQTVMSGVRGAAAELGIPLIEIETNARAMLDSYGDWALQSHGHLLAASALALSPTLRKIYIGSSTPYSNLSAWGSHPLTDPLWSTEDIEIFHDGAQFPRSTKVTLVAEDATALRWLRVCWQNPGNAYNCGRCDKCLRTMVSLDLCDRLQDCRTLPPRLDLDAVRRLRISITYHGTIQRLLRAAEAKNDAALAAALRECIAASGLDPDAFLSSDAETVSATREQLQTLLASRSWRLTAPLRAIGRTIRQMRVKTRRLRSHRSQRPS